MPILAAIICSVYGYRTDVIKRKHAYWIIGWAFMLSFGITEAAFKKAEKVSPVDHSQYPIIWLSNWIGLAALMGASFLLFAWIKSLKRAKDAMNEIGDE